MAFSNVDRTEEINKNLTEISVKSTDHCSYFEKHPDTLLWRRECWTCKSSDFGIDTGVLTDKGICRYKSEV